MAARSFDVCVEEVSAGVRRTSGKLQVERRISIGTPLKRVVRAFNSGEDAEQ